MNLVPQSITKSTQGPSPDKETLLVMNQLGAEFFRGVENTDQLYANVSAQAFVCYALSVAPIHQTVATLYLYLRASLICHRNAEQEGF